MKKQVWKPGNMLYPLPAVLVSCGDQAGGKNVLTAAWTGTINSEPPMVYVSLRPERYSHHMIQETGEYVLNLTTEKLVKAADWCGARSGRDCDKWREMSLTPAKAEKLTYAPVIDESPVNIECRVFDVKTLGSHDMFLAKVEAVQVAESLLDAKGRLMLERAGLLVYSHGAYFSCGRQLGTQGYSVRKKKS